MNRNALVVSACLGWSLFAMSLFTPAPADDRSVAALGGNCPADIAPPGGDGAVGVPDLLFIINNWGACPAGCNDANDCNDADPCTQDICINGECQNIQIAGCCLTVDDCPNVPNAISSCNVGQCSLICDAGYIDCDGLYITGCEVNVFNDVMNCGGCNIACIQPPNAVVTCVNGSCQFIGCLPGYADCNVDLIDGCEVFVDADVNHCGGCNMPCPPGWSCVAGQCVAP